ncbi:DUF6090 family protein [Fulvivirga sedimenti]|uniref:Uncharacterized protein n=1 Tax=Fulvivirga sedimenti TaxID=2879465 RepID=A0A9X1HU65_9BACT|nr:DUF6090 family protein [Fulvivirga sedimenti]MCA6075060.1 hypothetical protein [Fulvivirga sedimenti]MCA6076237.1 hypothetical protein [Fulvivirga sedimenti]MCA6077365.1 hypothetical protein [Fulvivirga sedimenti]
MINFFRKIRLKMLSESKTVSYFKYAIGEIILVVIGILIALQINTLNEQRKTRSETQSLLVALKGDLIQDTLLITDRLPFITQQYEFNETLRSRVAQPAATVDTLIRIMRFEFNPNWSAQIIYNTNSFNSLNQTSLIEELPDSLKSKIKTFYNRKFSLKDRVEKTTRDYQEKITSYVNTYTFGSTPIHDQGPLIDSLVWSEIDYSHLAATFQGISNFKRILFTETKEELEYSLSNSREIIHDVDLYLSQVK